MNQYYNPVHTIQGVGSTKKLVELAKNIVPDQGHVLLIIWDQRVLENENLNELVNSEELQVHSVCFSASNPEVEQLFELYCQTKQWEPSLIIAVGGGSVMDVGKSLCCLYGKNIKTADELREIIAEKKFGDIKSRWIGVPTTAGTGSEVTCWATIWDSSMDIKRSVESQKNYAYAAVVDPQLAENMPVQLAVSSALDAVAHAVESYWAKSANAVSRILALGAVRAIMMHIDSLLSGEREAHEYMAQGSMLAGMAFSNTKTTACHSISYPLTMHYHIPHGVAVSMLLAPVMQLNQKKTSDMTLLLDALGVESVQQLDSKIKSILRRAGIRASLQEWNVEREMLPKLAELGLTKGRADNNPVELNPVIIQGILESIYFA